jgi:hypothetical protein
MTRRRKMNNGITDAFWDQWETWPELAEVTGLDVYDLTETAEIAGNEFIVQLLSADYGVTPQGFVDIDSWDSLKAEAWLKALKVKVKAAREARTPRQRAK